MFQLPDSEVLSVLNSNTYLTLIPTFQFLNNCYAIHATHIAIDMMTVIHETNHLDCNLVMISGIQTDLHCPKLSFD